MTPIHMGVPVKIAEIGGAVVGFAGKLLGFEPPFYRELVLDMVGRYAYYECSETERDFRIESRATLDVLRDAVRWLVFLGKIKKGVADRIAKDLKPDEEW